MEIPGPGFKTKLQLQPVSSCGNVRSLTPCATAEMPSLYMLYQYIAYIRTYATYIAYLIIDILCAYVICILFVSVYNFI